MRYYSIEVEGGQKWTSHPDGPGSPPDPCAQQVEIDIMEAPAAVASVGSSVRIWGIPIQQIGQAFDLNRKQLTVRGGMGRGLPLANPGQAGVLARGTIVQAFGNWVGTDMTLDLVLSAPTQGSGIAGAETPDKLPLNWRAGQELGDAINGALSTAYGGYSINVGVRKGLVLPYDQIGYYFTLGQFSQFVKSASKDIVGPGYPGIDISTHDQEIRVHDGTSGGSEGSSGNAKKIDFKDLIGQPTWLNPQQISVTCVMRSDIRNGDNVTLPDTIVTISPNSTSAFTTLAGARQGSIFKGSFYVQTVRHVGNFRQPDGRSWTTILNCSANDSGLGTGAPATDLAPLQPVGMGSRRLPFN